MRVDRGEWAGTGAALAFHVALIAALSLSLAQVAKVPEPPAMEVDFVTDEVAMEAAAPTSIATPPPAAQSPTVEPVPEPDQPRATPPPLPQLRAVPQPTVRPAPQPPRAAPRPAPKSPARPAPARSRLGDDFLKGLDDDLAPRSGPARPSAPTFNAAAKANVASAIAAQIRPCALRQRELGSGANRIRVVLNLKLMLSGRLRGAPTVVRTTGVDDENRQFEELVIDQAIASYRQCAPLRLPADLYETPNGGWSNINMTYRVP